MDPLLEKLKKEITGNRIKGYASFVLIVFMLMIVFNGFSGDPIGKALEQEKTCEQVKGICSYSCEQGFTQTTNFCPENQYCCVKQ